jgi:hypothetical protein
MEEIERNEMNQVDGYWLLVSDLEEVPEIEEWDVADENVVRVKLKDGRQFRLTAEQTA